MPEQNTTTPAATTATATNAAPATEVTNGNAAPKPAPTVAEAKAARRAAAAAPVVKPEDKPAETAKPAETKVEVPNIDTKTLERIAALEAENRGLKGTVEGFDVAGAAKLAKAMQLVKDGKHVAAIEAMGFDITKANNELLGLQDDPSTGKPDERDAIIAELKTRLEKLEQNDNVRSSADMEAARSDAMVAATEHVKTNAKDFPLLAKSERWVKVALDKAQSAFAALPKDKRPTNDDDRSAFVLHFIAEEEKERAEDAKLLAGDNRETSSSPATNSGTSSQPRPTITAPGTGGNITPTNGTRKLSFAEVRKARREANQH